MPVPPVGRRGRMIGDDLERKDTIMKSDGTVDATDMTGNMSINDAESTIFARSVTGEPKDGPVESRLYAAYHMGRARTPTEWEAYRAAGRLAEQWNTDHEDAETTAYDWTDYVRLVLDTAVEAANEPVDMDVIDDTLGDEGWPVDGL